MDREIMANIEPILILSIRSNDPSFICNLIRKRRQGHNVVLLLINTEIRHTLLQQGRI